jgi:Tfp pilus assembly protein PilF
MNDSMTFAELERHALKLESERDLVNAAAAFEAALRLNDASQSCAEGRARIAIQLRDDNAAEHCARALAFHENNPQLQLRMIATAVANLGISASPLLDAYLDRHPRDIGALELMAGLQAEAGAGDDFVDRYRSAMSGQPPNKQLLMSYWNVLSRSGRLSDALESMDANRTFLENDRHFRMLEIGIAAHAGQIDRASKLLEEQDDRPDAQLARGLNRLQRGDPAKAARFLEEVVSLQAGNLEAWSLLELAWRMTEDRRHAWLVGEPKMYGAKTLNLTNQQLGEIAVTLRALHQASAQPIGQSVRGGTQTPGQLFGRTEPEIALLVNALTAAIKDFVIDLPPSDQNHPVLRYREAGMAFGPSWSIRFTDSGHHAAHFHPGGILSSACYICVPDTLADDIEKPGWLEIGRPPPELGLDIPPLETFQPLPGRLVLFPSFLFHGTRPFAGGERLTVAFDVVPVQA